MKRLLQNKPAWQPIPQWIDSKLGNPINKLYSVAANGQQILFRFCSITLNWPTELFISVTKPIRQGIDWISEFVYRGPTIGR